MEIGGIDSPVIKIKIAPGKELPYVPGSSLKGKMRCLMEQVKGATSVGGNEEVNTLFGYAKDNMPSKLIVRDAYLTKSSIAQLESCTDLDMPYTENKIENQIDRTKGKAEHPRQIERVPAGAEFDVEFVINVWEDDDETKLKELLVIGISLLENDYLGGSGSRGYGQVSFSPLTITELSSANNWKA